MTTQADRPTTGTAGSLRVLYVGHTAKLSGGEIALLRLLRGLPKHIEPLVVLAEEGPLVSRLEGEGIEVMVLPLSPEARELRKERLSDPLAGVRQLTTVFSYALLLRRLIRARRVDVVHTNTLKAGFYGSLAARLARVPCVWHVRDRLADDYLPTLAVLATRLALTVLPARILCNSRTTAETVMAGPLAGRRRKLLAAPLYDPLDVDALFPAAPARPPCADFTVGMVGRLAPWKGQHLVIRALAQLPPPTRLVLIGAAMFGEDDYVARLHEEVARLGLADRVEFRGFTEDVFAALEQVDVLVHASVVPEPFGQVVVEGLAAGVPVIAARGGGPSEILTDGEDGLLHDAGDVAGIAGLIRSVQQDAVLRERLVTNGRRRARDFAPAAVCPPLVDLYAELAFR